MKSEFMRRHRNLLLCLAGVLLLVATALTLLLDAPQGVPFESQKLAVFLEANAQDPGFGFTRGTMKLVSAKFRASRVTLTVGDVDQIWRHSINNGQRPRMDLGQHNGVFMLIMLRCRIADSQVVSQLAELIELHQDLKLPLELNVVVDNSQNRVYVQTIPSDLD